MWPVIFAYSAFHIFPESKHMKSYRIQMMLAIFGVEVLSIPEGK